MKPRITLNVTAEGIFELWLNPEGRDLLVRELQSLNEVSEHRHLSPDDGAEIQVPEKPYSPSDTVLSYGKINFRLDEWDKEFFPQVMSGD